MYAIRSYYGFALVLASLIFAELLLHVLGAASHAVRSVLTPPAERNTRWIEDTRLRLRSNPLWLEHDANGYRNPHALTHADIVTLVITSYSIHYTKLYDLVSSHTISVFTFPSPLVGEG